MQSTALAVKEYEEKLEKESLDILMKLSPGVRLQTIINQSKISPQEQIQKGQGGVRTLQVLPEIKEQPDVHKIERWDIIINTLETKRREYRKQRKQQVIEHSIKSQKRLLPIRKKIESAPESQAESIRDRWKKINTTIRVSPDESSEIKVKRKPVAPLSPKKTHKPVITKYVAVSKPLKPKAQSKINEIQRNAGPPVLRALSIDQPLQADAKNLWNRNSHKMPEQIVERIATIVQMSNKLQRNKEQYEKSLISGSRSWLFIEDNVEDLKQEYNSQNSKNQSSTTANTPPENYELCLTNETITHANETINQIAKNSRRTAKLKNIQLLKLNKEEEEQPILPKERNKGFSLLGAVSVKKFIKRTREGIAKGIILPEEEPEYVSPPEYPKIENQPLSLEALVATTEVKFIEPRKIPSVWTQFQ